MKAQHSHEVFSSFYLWFEKQLSSSDLAAMVPNQSNRFNLTTFNDVPTGYYAYQGIFRQWVTDHSVSPPNSGVFVNGSFITGSNTGIYLDYSNGRVIVPHASGSGLTITANSHVREVSLYPAEDDEEQMILSSDFIDSTSLNSTYLSDKTTKRNKKTYILPACFVRLKNVDNRPVSFGGEDDTRTMINVLVLATDNFVMDGLFSHFSDMERSCIKHVPYSSYPYGFFNSIKSFPYSYDSFVSGIQTNHYIESVRTSKLLATFSHDKLQKDLIIGYLDFELSSYRYPRI